MHALRRGDLADDEAERHHAVGHRQRVGVAQVDLLLARSVLVEAVLDRDAHRLERADRLLAQRPGDVVGGQVEEAGVVERLRRDALLRRGEVEELDVRGDVEDQPLLVGRLDVALEHVAAVAAERCAVEVVDVAEDPRLGGLGVAERQQLERVRIGDGQDVGFLDPREALDR